MELEDNRRQDCRDSYDDGIDNLFRISVEIKADAILKGTRVDGVYTADPEKDPSAKKYEQLTFQEAMAKKLKVMDLTAFALCEENNLPIYVFDMNKPGNLLKAVSGENIGTEVHK